MLYSERLKSCHTVFAWNDIRQGEEITIDYRLNAFSDDCWECVCGSANCRGFVVGSFFALSYEKQLDYLPYAPKFIQREYRRRLRRAKAAALSNSAG